MSELDPRTRRWWSFLRGVSALNVVAWCACLAAFGVPADHGVAQLALSAVFVVVCAFRSFVPRVDLERTVLIDHPISGIVLGRTSATVAEMSFTIQSALVLEVLGRTHGVAWMGAVALAVVPLIALAQCACWAGVLTLNHLWHGVEEALWTVYVVLCGICFAALWPSAESNLLKGLLVLGGVGCVGSAILMSGIDVPMYIKRFREGREKNETLLSASAGFQDALVRRVPTGSWDVWRHEVPWMSLYFSGGVWLSLVMAWAPLGQLR